MLQVLKITDICRIINGTFVVQGDDFTLSGISTDTRIIAEGELFIALKGQNFDGHDFAPEAIAKGAAGVVVSRTDWLEERTDSPNVILVHDTVQALQQIAAHLRRASTAQVLGITGSTGKTIVKDMVYAILSRQFHTLATPLSFHGQIGLPLTLLKLESTHEKVVLELGISRPGEMEILSQIAPPDYAILTNISPTHLEYLGNMENIVSEKAKLFSRFSSTDQIAILNGDDAYCQGLVDSLSCSIITFGLGESCDYRAVDIRPAGKRGNWFSLRSPKGEKRLFLNAPGRHNILNALAAIAGSITMGADFEAVSQALNSFNLPQMRLEIHTSSALEEQVTIINDAYSASPASVEGALEALVDMAGSHRRIAVLGDMLELGNFSITAHRNIGDKVVQHEIHHLITIGAMAREIGKRAVELGWSENRVHHCSDTVEAAEHLQNFLKENDFILFKGSRFLQLDRLAAQFIGGIRPTRLEIDLDAIAYNVRAIREYVGHGVKIMAVVKSGGYGHDSRRVAQEVLDNGADQLAVAVPDEGIFLRKSGFTEVPILVLGPTLPQEMAKVIKYDLAQVVSSFSQAVELQREAHRMDKSIAVHLKVDTGMGRIGFAPQEVLPFVIMLHRDLKRLRLEGIMTHLSAADDPAASSFTEEQIELFSQICDSLVREGFEVPYRHAAASSGLLAYPHAWFDMVRPGIMIYGLYPSEAMKKYISLKPAASFKTRIACIKEVPAGAPISYSRTYYTRRPSRIATIPVGYYDGYSRLLSNKAEVLIRGRRAPVVGTVTMDMTMVDVTDIPEAVTGDEVVLFGRDGELELDVTELSTLCGTINYEFISTISSRVSRVYNI